MCRSRCLALIVCVAALAACTRKRAPTTPTRSPTPLASIQVGECGEPGRDGVMGERPRVERADRDLDGDGRPEPVAVDRAMCTPEGNCYWNVFRAGGDGECTRFAGTLAGAALETMTGRGDDNMTDVRGYWNLHGGRMLLQSYRFLRDGYQIVDTLLCRRGADDRLDCADTAH
jgi:hypothetical protein